MDSILLQIKDVKAYKFIENLEALTVVKILRKSSHSAKHKLSRKFAGSLKLTNKQYQDFQNQTKEMRDEWERNI